MTRRATGTARARPVIWGWAAVAVRRQERLSHVVTVAAPRTARRPPRRPGGSRSASGASGRAGSASEHAGARRGQAWAYPVPVCPILAVVAARLRMARPPARVAHGRTRSGTGDAGARESAIKRWRAAGCGWPARVGCLLATLRGASRDGSLFHLYFYETQSWSLVVAKPEIRVAKRDIGFVFIRDTDVAKRRE